MKNKTNLTGCAVGAAALFVGLAGNVQAIPITLPNYTASQAAGSVGQSKLFGNLASQVKTHAAKPAKGKKGGKHGKPSPGSLTNPVLGGLTPLPAFPVGSLNSSASGTTSILPGTILPKPSSPVVSAQGAGPTSVPDGGTTATMAGAALGGLALLKRKMKA